MANYKEKKIDLEGDKALIARVKKAGIQVFKPYLGFSKGWAVLGRTHALIRSVWDMRRYNKIVKELALERETKKPSKSPYQKWVARLVKLTGIDVEEAERIADEKIEDLEERIEELNERDYRSHSMMRCKLIDKLRRSNPLRRIEGWDHAQAILAADRRHNFSNYEACLLEAHDLVKEGELDKGDVQEYARNNTRYFHFDEE